MATRASTNLRWRDVLTLFRGSGFVAEIFAGLETLLRKAYILDTCAMQI
jgi:hypothetical protein